MDSNLFILPILCISLFLSVQLLVASRKLSNDEDLELENHLKLLNKPALATIRTNYGEQYDCVDFYKQRAFDHPALKNHDFFPEMRPSSHSRERFHKHSSRNDQSFKNIWLNGKGCPTGSVPVKRFTKDDLIRIKSAEKIYAQTYEPNSLGEHGTHYAVMLTNTGIETELYGAGMTTSIYNPPVSGSQYSSSQVKLSNGLESIEAGWTVNPSLYNDNKTRIFIYTNGGAFRCFNTYCPGFVSIGEDRPLDLILPHISQSGGNIYEVPFFIHKNEGKWWLQIGPQNNTFGYWPEAIFTSLKEHANYAEWGGKVYSPPNMPSPPMGVGNKRLRLDTLYDAYCSGIRTVDKSYNITVAIHTAAYNDIKQYKVEDIGNFKDEDGHVFAFGGPGGYTGN